MLENLTQARYADVHSEALVLNFNQVGIIDIPLVGGENVSLGEMIQNHAAKDISVPNGFATTAYAYRCFIQSGYLEQQLRRIFANLNVEDVQNLQERGKQARSLMLQTPFPQDLQNAIAWTQPQPIGNKKCQKESTSVKNFLLNGLA